MEQKEEIEGEIGEILEWSERPNLRESQVYLIRQDTDIANRKDWFEQHKWLHEKLEQFDKVFRNRIKALDAADWQPDDEDEE